MFRTIRRVAILAIALTLAAPTGARAGFFNNATTSTTIPGGLGGGVLTSNLCGPVTPVVYALDVSVPPTGTGNECMNDLQCTGDGEACTFPSGSSTGTCMASGLLKRGDISYVAGKLVDVEVTIPECTTISEVNGATLVGQGGFDSTSSTSWSFLPYGAPTTVDGQPAIRERVRIQFPNFGDGQTSSMTIKVVARTGSASITQPFTIASVAAVNAAMRNTVSETQIRNSFVTRLYQKFGDYEQILDGDGDRIAYGVDWDELEEFNYQGRRFFRNSDIRILDGEIAVSTEFKGDVAGCDPTASVYGWFTLLPKTDGYDFQWLGGPTAGQYTGACAFLTLGVWELIIDGLADESALEKDLAKSLGAAFGVDEFGHSSVCEGCRVKDVVIGDGKIDVWTVPPTERVRLNVATDRRSDATADPASRGLILPAGMYAPIIGGGSYESCQAADGHSPATCPVKFDVDTDGLFNWWGSDVPVPSPIVYGPDGGAGILGGRQHAWARLLGLTRDVTKLPEASFPAGSLLARRTPLNAVTPTTRARVTKGCVMPPNLWAPYRVSFGVNDIAVPAAGDPPTRGKLDVTVLMAADAGQSETLFGGFDQCTAVPSTSPILGTTTGTVVRSR